MAAAAEVVSEVVPKREAATGGGMLHSSDSVASHSSHTRSITACHTPTTRCDPRLDQVEDQPCFFDFMYKTEEGRESRWSARCCLGLT